MWAPKYYMGAIRQFLLSYPLLEPFGSNENEMRDRLVVEYFKTTPQNAITPEGYAMAVVGTNIIKRQSDISGNIILRKRANFQFLIKRYTQINEQRREVGDFIIDFCDWINSENELKSNPLLPKFSDTPYEQIIADGGMELATDIEPTQSGAIDLFVLQLHLEWESKYGNHENNANKITNDFYNQLKN